MSLEVSSQGRSAARRLLAAAAIAATTALAGCGASQGIGGDSFTTKLLTGTMTGPKEMDPAVYAATPICPLIEVRDGTEFMPMFASGKMGDPSAIQFQASVQRVARDCDEVSGGIRVRVGAAGRVLSGPTGATGSVTVPIRVAAVVDNRVVYSKLTTATVPVQAPDYSALYSVVDDGLVLSVADTKAATIYVGLDGSGDVRKAAAPKKAKKLITK